MEHRVLSLSGKVALVTGASRGIGRAIALALATTGADVMCVARSADALQQTADLVRATGSRGEWLALDLSTVESPANAVRETIRRFRRIDILVNNAGRPYVADSPASAAERWDHVQRLNLRAPYLLCEEAAPHFEAQRSGKIINVTSMLSLVADRGSSAAYVASKHGLLGLTRSLALRWADKGINVNAVAPGWIETELTLPEARDENISRSVIARTPVGRWGVPDDIVGAVVFLASPSSDFMTGQTIVIDGGWTAQ